MNREDFKKLIREEVRTAIREELRSILVEAVTIASTPEQTSQAVRSMQTTTPKIQLYSTEEESKSYMDILQETAKTITSSDIQNVMGTYKSVSFSEKPQSSLVSDMSFEASGLPAFAKNAAAIFEASNRVKK